MKDGAVTQEEPKEEYGDLSGETRQPGYDVMKSRSKTHYQCEVFLSFHSSVYSIKHVLDLTV